MIADDFDDLHQKINKKFIRNVIKPMEQMQRRSDDLPFQIPSASELFGYPHPSADNTASRGGSLPIPRHPRDEHAGNAGNAGMGVGNASNYGAPLGSSEHVPFQPEAYAPPRRHFIEERPPPRRMIRPLDIHEEYQSPAMSTRIQATPTPTPTPDPINCVTICAHVQSCPVCSQLYRPYTGIYLAVIVILIIVILFLLKKIFQF